MDDGTNLFESHMYAMYTQTVRGVCVEVVEKRFTDGTAGKLVTLLKADGNVLKAWCPERTDRGDTEGYELVTENDVSGYDDFRAITVTMKLREWDGQTKRTIVNVVND